MSSTLLQSSSDDISTENVVRKTDSWRDIYKSEEFAQFAPTSRKTDNRLHTSTSTTTVATSDISSNHTSNDTSNRNGNGTSNRSSSIVRHSWRTTQTSSFDLPNVVSSHQSRSESITRNSSHTYSDDISTNDMTFPASQSFESEWNTTLAEQAMILAKFERDSKRAKTSAFTSTINTDRLQTSTINTDSSQSSTLKRSKSLASTVPMLMDSSEVDNSYMTNGNIAALLNEDNLFTEEVSM